MVIFQNEGEIDPLFLGTFGVSVKETENPIGFFGTGLKYAVAILLRTSHRITLKSGLHEYEFGTVKRTLRGKEFDLVTLNDRQLGFSTELGKTWKVWMAYRELYCNAIDEGGSAYHSSTPPEAVPNRTFIIVEGPEIEEVYQNRENYFISGTPEIELEGVQIWRKPSNQLFYRGIRVADLRYRSIFTYNITDSLTLSEDRSLANYYEAMRTIAIAYLRSDNESLLREVLLAAEGTYENSIDYSWLGYEPSSSFLKVVENLSKSRMLDVAPSAVKVYLNKKPISPLSEPFKLTKVQSKMLERALDFCSKIGFDVRGYDIKTVRGLGDGVLGLANNGTIYISELAFDRGTKQLASTLIEEYIHIAHGYSDCTRQLQNFLFDKIISLGEELMEEPV